MKKLLLIIPAYNEEKNIDRVMKELLLEYQIYDEFDYLIINDGSKDGTERICQQSNYHYINMPVNVGLAGVFRTGMKYADRYGYEMVLQYDGDGQHNPKYISEMVQEMKMKDVDIVIGSRYKSEFRKYTSFRVIGNYFLQKIVYITTRKKITDPTSGMRLYGKRMIHLFGNNINMPPEPDTLAYLLRCGYKIEEIEVQMRERQAGTSYLDFGNSIRYMIHMFTSMIFIQRFRKGEIE